MRSADLKHKLNILIIGGHGTAGQVLGNALRTVGYTHIKQISNTKLALEHIQHQRYHVMLIFLSSHKESGLDLIKQIRQGETAAPADQLVVLIETEAEAEDESGTGFLGALGINAIARMPLTPKMLDDAVRHAISHAHVSQAAIEVMHAKPEPAKSDELPEGFSPEVFQMPAGAMVDGMLLAEDITIHDRTLVPAKTILTSAHLDVLDQLGHILELREFKVYLKSKS